MSRIREYVPGADPAFVGVPDEDMGAALLVHVRAMDYRLNMYTRSRISPCYRVDYLAVNLSTAAEWTREDVMVSAKPMVDHVTEQLQHGRGVFPVFATHATLGGRAVPAFTTLSAGTSVDEAAALRMLAAAVERSHWDPQGRSRTRIQRGADPETFALQTRQYERGEAQRRADEEAVAQVKRDMDERGY